MVEVKWKIPKLRYDEKLEWMSPVSFLMKVPHPTSIEFPAFLGCKHDIEKMERGEPAYGWDLGSYRSIKERIFKGEEVDALYLDYKRMWYGWPSHEGRHRALVCYALGIDEVPVIIREGGE